jgi:hypothetical protein
MRLQTVLCYSFLPLIFTGTCTGEVNRRTSQVIVDASIRVNNASTKIQMPFERILLLSKKGPLHLNNAEIVVLNNAFTVLLETLHNGSSLIVFRQKDVTTKEVNLVMSLRQEHLNIIEKTYSPAGSLDPRDVSEGVGKLGKMIVDRIGDQRKENEVFATTVISKMPTEKKEKLSQWHSKTEDILDGISHFWEPFSYQGENH